MSFTAFQLEVLQRHNVLRAKHSAVPLQLDASMCQYAQQWANYIASRNVMQHRSNNKYGENIYASFGRTKISGTEVGHFTQVVWKKSRSLGVGIAVNGKNVYVVCNYNPPGNYGGQYPVNVTRS